MQPRTMAVNVKLTVVVDNHVADTRLLGEHGLALWAETAAGNVLSDAGQGLTIEHNLRQLGIDPKRADAVVISHGHYDHTGGLDFVWEYAHGAELFLHPGAMAAKYARHENAVDEIGMPRSVREQIRRDKWRIVWTREHRRVLPGVFVTGQIPRVSGFEDDGGVFLLDGKGEVQDGVRG